MSLIVNREAHNKVPIVFIQKISSNKKEELISFCIQETKEKFKNIHKDYSYEQGFVLPNNNKYPIAMTSPQMGRQLRFVEENGMIIGLRFKDGVIMWDEWELNELANAIRIFM
jgi:hypothetical protein